MSFAHDKRNQKSNLSRIEFLNSAEVKKLYGLKNAVFRFLLKLHEMSAVHPQPLEPSFALTISEDGNHVTKDRFSSAKCHCCHKRYLICNFRVWQLLLLLFAILVIMGGIAVLAAIFGPGKATLEEDYTGIRN